MSRNLKNKQNPILASFLVCLIFISQLETIQSQLTNKEIYSVLDKSLEFNRLQSKNLQQGNSVSTEELLTFHSSSQPQQDMNLAHERLQSPKVEATTGSIWSEQPFTTSIYYSYFSAVQTGLNLKWDSTGQCFQSFYWLLNDLFYLHQNITGYTVSGVVIDNGSRKQAMVAYNISNIVARNYANTILNCYLMLADGVSDTETRLSQFADFSDVYTSFLFNLLSQSLKLRQLSTNLQKAQDDKDWVTFWKTWAQLLRLIFSFESSNAESLEDLTFADVMKVLNYANGDMKKDEKIVLAQKMIVASASFLKKVVPSMSKPINVDRIMKNQKKVNDFIDRLESTTGPDMTFRPADILNIIFGVIEGSMGAIPSSTFNFQCGKNTTLARQYTDTMVQEFSKNEIGDGVAQFHKILQLADDLTINCVSAVATTDTSTGTLFAGDNLLQNFLYNAGFMFTDVLDIVWYDTRNTDPYWYYFSYRLGDFLIRIIYRDES